MAKTTTKQCLEKISVSRDKIMEIATMNLSKTSYRVLLYLLTYLEGHTHTRYGKDPLNFKKINKNAIAEALCIEKKDVKKAIDDLVYQGILEPGESEIVSNGYRFTF